MNKEDKKEYKRQYYLKNKCPHNKRKSRCIDCVVLKFVSIIELNHNVKIVKVLQFVNIIDKNHLLKIV